MTKHKSEDDDIFSDVLSDSEKVTEGELSDILKNENGIRKKVSRLNLAKFSKLIKQLTLSFMMLKDYKEKHYTNIPWRTIALIVAAILYFINPFDIIPDLLPFLGFTDDAVAFAAIFKSAQTDLMDYCNWKGLNTEEYF
ncbi:MAG: DUF1232 domain-containing protein [Ignavibacteriae bacterium]|nr:DUF1232 domain-containing protein [Ignavibacteriota bacterium]